MTPEAIFEGLNPEQRRGVEAVAGPVCILAGAGSGKTTTITRRIANQVATGAFDVNSILALTFTDRAAGEMRSRLEVLGIPNVRARTFHSAALAQLRHFSREELGQILPSKVVPLRQIANTLPKPYRFRPAADLATEVEWAKNRRITPDAYRDSLGDHEPPIPEDLMARVFSRYEDGKRQRNLMDFEDLLELTIRLFDTEPWVQEEFSARYRAFTVDEYQDVNLLQETLLRAWVGEGDNLCVVGDDYQSIYGFTGASAEYLLDMPQRFAGTKVIRLETNYRSTPQVLALANRLVPNLGGAEKVLVAALPAGPEPSLRQFSTPAGELQSIVTKIAELHTSGVAYEQMAILYRVNFRSEDYEEVLAAEAIPYQVADGAFLTRATGRQMLSALKRSKTSDVAAEVRKIAVRAGYVTDPGDDLGEQEITRQNDLARFVALAEEFDDGERTAADFVADIEQRFGGGGQGRGVNLLTLHRAKGLEFDAVFLPRVEEHELPFRRSRTEAAIAEERRLFYVGLTRAKTHLAVSWVQDGKRKASKFIRELQGDKPLRTGKSGLAARIPERDAIPAEVGLFVELTGGFCGTVIEVDAHEATIELEGGTQIGVAFGEPVTSLGKTLPLAPPATESDRLVKALKAWRLQRAKTDEVPAYVVFHDSTLQEIAATRPRDLDELGAISGIGPSKLDRYGTEVLALLKDDLVSN
ncbi:MAG TPA: ATP-dependent DNA helicase UvrD2 [Actinomycetota bacterium]|nr:ATP-dependent DNA helicase UvrD2 [Actinomycetota bacterium]